jgi:hypothetical protein
MKARLRRMAARLRRHPDRGDPGPGMELWHPTYATARELQAHGLVPWPDAAGVSWPGGLIECRQHLTASAWADDVTALVLRARRGGTLWRRMPRLCERCRNDAAN